MGDVPVPRRPLARCHLSVKHKSNHAQHTQTHPQGGWSSTKSKSRRQKFIMSLLLKLIISSLPSPLHLTLTACWPSMLRAFFTRFLHASRSKLQEKDNKNMKTDYVEMEEELPAYRFVSSMPRSLPIVFISPSRNLRNGCVKQMPEVAMKSCSHWPNFCSAWPTLISAWP